MREVTLKGFQRHAVLRYGKQWVKIDLAQALSDYFNEPMSKVKRNIKQDGLDMIVRIKEYE